MPVVGATSCSAGLSCRAASGTSDSMNTTASPPRRSARRTVLDCSDAIQLRSPLEAELVGRLHVSDERGGRDDRGAGEVALAPKPHTILPVPVERRDRALAGRQRIFALPEA